MSNTTWFAANNHPRGGLKSTNYSYNGSYRTITLAAGSYLLEV